MAKCSHRPIRKIRCVFAERFAPYSCSYQLPLVCQSSLPYTSTSSSDHIQSLLSESTKDILARLQASNCYDQSAMFVCATRYPSCQDNGLPLFPCKYQCECEYEYCYRVMTICVVWNETNRWPVLVDTKQTQYKTIHMYQKKFFTPTHTTAPVPTAHLRIQTNCETP